MFWTAFCGPALVNLWRRGSLVVSAFVPEWSGTDSNPDQEHCVVFLGRTPLSTQEYKWVPVNCWRNLTNCWGVTCEPETGISSGSYEPVGSMALLFHYTLVILFGLYVSTCNNYFVHRGLLSVPGLSLSFDSPVALIVTPVTNLLCYG